MREGEVDEGRRTWQEKVQSDDKGRRWKHQYFEGSHNDILRRILLF